MKIRKSYRIAGRDIKVLKGTADQFPQLRRNGGKEYAGDCNFSKDQITINSKHSEDEEFSTLLHESIHMLDDIFCIKLSEEQVRKLERGLYMYLTDNFTLKHKNNRK